MNALRRLGRGSILGLAVLGTVMFVAGPTTAVFEEAQGRESGTGFAMESIGRESTPDNVDPFVSASGSEGSVAKSQLPCFPGYVHYWDEEYGYEVWLGDILFEPHSPRLDTVPVYTLTAGCGVGPDGIVFTSTSSNVDIGYVAWEMTGDVGTPDSCGSFSLLDCGFTYPMNVVGACDEEATFEVFIWDTEWELIYYDEIFITYSISNNPPTCDY